MKTTPGQGMNNGRLFEFEALPSTNLWAMENIHELAHGDVILTVRQTSGRGRFDRSWISPEDRCLTLSVVIDSNPPREALISTISQTAALAVSATLEKLSIAAMVKWPNDVMAGGRKISGILAERDTGTGLIVLGIGINVNMTAADFTGTQLMQPATSMKIETQRDHDTRQVMRILLLQLEKMTEASTAENPLPAKAWEAKDFLKGKNIEIQTADLLLPGSYSGIDKSGRLRLTDSSGKLHLFWSGDVSVRMQAGE